ncbi:MAG TPA: DUF1553 domain-containing protein [Planctomycetota bacterium]|nr:DUF1553 domain-containing protein [Planctomycetota bacterium]
MTERTRVPGGVGLLLLLVTASAIMAADAPRAALPVPGFDEKQHWAFRPLGRGDPPPVKDLGWASSPIDQILLSRLEEAGIEPAPPAPRRELIRRAYFDLIGLPPPIDEVEDLERDDSPDAWGRLVDRLLASPQYGERWGRHWLDVVRYGESNGYERDGEKAEAWRYRDYVIQAFNDDKPYDRFVIEQLAGDELDEFTRESTIATGYYHLGVWDDEPDDARAARYEGLDDIVRVTGAAFLGLTVGCARCHDHMFDPVPQEDYYRFLSFFHNVKLYERGRLALDSASYAPLAPPGEVESWKAARDERVRALEARIAAVPAPEGDARKKLEGEIKREKESVPPFEWALSVRESGPSPRPTRVLVRGDAAHEGATVEAAFLTALGGGIPAPAPGRSRGGTSGLRRALAEWIASPENPLSARVLVNRVWQHHFGRGIVDTPDDFGKAGSSPTHPALLDALARDFIDGGWSVKRLHKLIMMSSAYRMSSRMPRTGVPDSDPANHLLWRQNMKRLEAEAIRDSILSVSGRLVLRRGGRGFFPALGGEVLAGQSRPGLDWEISSPAERLRRSVYIFVKRTLRVPLLETFDYVNTDQPLGVRSVTTVSPQALLLLNSDFLHEEAGAFAGRLLEGTDAAGELGASLVDRAYRLAFARSPTDREREVALRYMDEERRAVLARKPTLVFESKAPLALEGGYLRRLAAPDHLLCPPGWTASRGVWLDRGEGILWADRSRGPHALLEGEPFVDGSASCRMRLERDGELASLLIRATKKGDGWTGYEACLDFSRKVALLRRHDGETKDLASVPFPGDPGAWRSVRVEAIAARISLHVDGSLLLEAEDREPLLAPGRVGARAWGAPLQIEDLVLAAGSGETRVDSGGPATEDEARREALQAFCLALFNLNEFVYVD